MESQPHVIVEVAHTASGAESVRRIWLNDVEIPVAKLDLRWTRGHYVEVDLTLIASLEYRRAPEPTET
jgi:hypothetical protein